MDQPRRRWAATPDPLGDEQQPTVKGVVADLKRVPAMRLLATALIIAWAILFARYSWEAPISLGPDRAWHFPARATEPRVTIPISTDAERALYDIRQGYFEQKHTVDQDKRILLIPYTQDTLRATAKRSPLDRAILARALANIDKMGAKAIGVDILIDQPQQEDSQLFATLKAMKTPVWLAYATRETAGPEIEHWQLEYMDHWFAQLAGSQARPASVRFEVDGDNVLRRWPSLPPGLPPLMPIALTGARPDFSYQGSVDFRLPATQQDVFPLIQIDLLALPEVPTLISDQIKGHIVMIGGDFPNIDRFEIPATRLDGPTTSGMEVHATMAAQLLDGRLPAQAGSGLLWILAILVVLCGAFTAMLDVRPTFVALAVLGQTLFFGSAPFYFEWNGIDTYGLPAFGWLGGWVLAYAATGAAVRAVGSDQRRYAQSALGKYLPHDIAAQILRDPTKLTLTGEKRQLYTLFTDIEGFTALSHRLPPERVAGLLNAYLDGMSDIVLDHGGTIDKFVGDAVVAFWGAPIANDDDGERAAAAALIAMIDFTQRFSVEHGDDATQFGRTRAGLHFGEAVVGNFGGEGRLSYTALGDAMNSAARLEGANKWLKSVALISEEARQRSGLDILRPMGRIILSGRATPIVVWEPAADFDPDARAELGRLWHAFDGGESSALDRIEQICLTHDNDAALAAFACRLREAGPGGAVALREK